MSFFETFAANLGNYAVGGGSEASWSATYGNPTAGSAKIVGRGAAASGGPLGSVITNSTDTYTLTSDAPTLYCNARFTSVGPGYFGGGMAWCVYPLIWTVGFQVEADLDYYLAGTGFGSDSGWVQLAFPLTGRLTGVIIDRMAFRVPVPGASPASCGSDLIITAYIDSITIGTPPTLGPGEPAGGGGLVYVLTHSAGGVPGSVLI